jgi:hypothetical protein
MTLTVTTFWQDVVTENEFEKNLLSNVIPPKDIRVTFEDIGALEYVKDILKELVMVPLQRPELFSKGQLRKVCSSNFKRAPIYFKMPTKNSVDPFCNVPPSYQLHFKALPTSFFFVSL